MKRWIIGLLMVGLFIGGCNSKPPLPPDPTKPVVGFLRWSAGLCTDNYLVYQKLGDGWIQIDETVQRRVAVTIAPQEEKTLTVAGVCFTGPQMGTWMSAESVTVKR